MVLLIKPEVVSALKQPLMHFLYRTALFYYYRLMKKWIRLFQVALAACFVMSGTACAGEITLQIKAGSTHRENTVIVFTEITNLGNVSAHNVWVEAEVFGRTGQTETHELLPVDATSKDSLLMGELPELRGIYTVVIKVHYEDANGHPFTALSYIPFISKMPELPDDVISGEIDQVSVRKSEDVRVVLRQEGIDGGVGLAVSLRIVLPDEMESDVSSAEVGLVDALEREMNFSIYNKSAVAGSVYSFYVIADYEWEGLHRSIPLLGVVEILERTPWPSYTKSFAIGLLVLLGVWLLVVNLWRGKNFKPMALADIPYLDMLILGVIFLFTLYQLQPRYLFMDTLTVGGDMAAHNHMASHLREQLFGHGRLISWSHGWWCGFPMFQYYFCLPYLVMALLDILLPFNVAFKLVSVSGMLLLPAAVYVGARIMRAARPIPIICAIMMVPYLFVRAHTMWGVSAYSTLAGMISNSISFPIMILFIASAWRDSEVGKFRVGIGVLFALLMASHFFTSIVAALTVLVFPLLKPGAGIKKSFMVLAGEAILGLALMAWWIIPLVAKNEFSVEFGTNWDVPFFQRDASFPYVSIMAFPAYALLLLPFVGFGLWRGLRDRDSFLIIALGMFVVSTFLFLFGFHIVGHVFVNIRLWPFMFYSFLILVAYGMGRLAGKLKGVGLALIALLLVALVFGVEQPNDADDWAKWNFEGVENKRAYPVIADLVVPLKGTPGRLANDLSDANDKGLGSSRAFELVPHLTGKPILEGGIVNSAVGSIFSYYIQGETSESCAGFPSIVEPTGFNFTNATKHLELFNVKHFIARWAGTKKALAESSDWKFMKRSLDWELYELTTHDGSYVVIPENYPVAMNVGNWKQAGLDWIYDAGNIDQLYILLRGGEQAPSGVDEARDMGYSERKPTGADKHVVSVSEYTAERIAFKTDGIGLPHLIKCTYYPNWKVRGADKVYMVTPCFMLVYPESEDVELYYGSLFSDNAGRLITLLGVLFLLVYIGKRMSDVRTKQSS